LGNIFQVFQYSIYIIVLIVKMKKNYTLMDLILEYYKFKYVITLFYTNYVRSYSIDLDIYKKQKKQYPNTLKGFGI